MDKLDVFLIKFVDHMRTTGFSERTIPDYERNVKYFLDYLREIRIENISEVDRKVITDYQAKVYLQTYRDKPITPATKKARLTCVKTFYRYLLKANIVLFDPSSDIDLPKRPKTIPKDILTKKEMSDLLSAPNLETPLGIRDRAMMEIFYGTGIRVSELCDITMNDVDLYNGELRINQGKNAKDRVVPLGEIAADFLDFYIREARPKLTFPDQTYLFVTKNGNRFDYTNLSFRMNKYGKRKGIGKPTSPHTFRHTCATHLLKGKADIRSIQALLGHSSIETTQLYTRVDITDLKKVLKKHHPRERRELDVR